MRIRAAKTASVWRPKRRLEMRPTAIVAGLIALFTAVGCGDPSAVAPERAAGGPARTAAEEVTLKVLDYAEIEKLIAGHRGKVVVVDCWSTSCPPCIQEFPKLVGLHKKYGPDKVACVSLSFDYEGIGKPQDVKGPVLEFLKKQGANFDNVLNAEESDVLYRKMELTSIPAVYVYDKDGNLAERFTDENAYASAIPLVEKLVVGTSP